MVKIYKFPPRLKVVKPYVEKKKPRPRKKKVTTEITVYDCPECGAELEKPTDPDIRVTMTFQCPNCGYYF